MLIFIKILVNIYSIQDKWIYFSLINRYRVKLMNNFKDMNIENCHSSSLIMPPFLQFSLSSPLRNSYISLWI